VLAAYTKWLLALDEEVGVWVIDLRKTLLPVVAETHGLDPIHPNQKGLAIMAEIFLKECPKIMREAAE
jgi:lysophospholipase L1-like esterase